MCWNQQRSGYFYLYGTMFVAHCSSLIMLTNRVFEALHSINERPCADSRSRTITTFFFFLNDREKRHRLCSYAVNYATSQFL